MAQSTVNSVQETENAWIALEVCPICSATDHRPFEAVEDGGRKLNYRICRSCGAVFQSPRIGEHALEDYYRADYAAEHQGVTGVTQKELRVQAGRARHIVRLLGGSLRSVHRHLDVGSSTGSLLIAVGRKYGCRSVGIEPAELYRRYSSGIGLAVHPSLPALAAEDQTRFDLITLAHVLEHLPDPVRYLREIQQTWLEPAGHLLIEVPNLFGHRSFELPHLLAFHAAMLRRTLFEAGFELNWVVRHGIPRSKLIPLYLTALAAPRVESDRRTPPRGSVSRVRLGRTAGMAWHQIATRFAPRWAWLPFPEPLDSSTGDPRSGEA